MIDTKYSSGKPEELYEDNDPGIKVSREDDKAKGLLPLEDQLEIRWFKAPNYSKKIYTVVCGPCGNNKLLKAERGIRCHNCGVFHSYTSYNTMKLKLHRMAYMGDSLVEKVEQPKMITNQTVFLDSKTKRFIEDEQLKKRMMDKLMGKKVEKKESWQSNWFKK